MTEITVKRQKMYVRKAISTLLSHKDIKRTSHSELKQACEEALKTLDEQYPLNNGISSTGSGGSSGGPASPGSNSIQGSVLPEPNPLCVQVEKFFLPFELACHSKTPKIVCSALDSIEKLVAYGHISYEFFEDPEDETIKLFDDHLTETVANCFSGPQTDEGIQVQVLKALLSIVTSGHIRVHQETLLLAVKTCYNIFLASRNLNYQATAKATLSQMLNCVYNRMEQACDEAEAEKLKILKEREELQLQNSAENENSNEINPQDLVQDILNDVVNHVVDVCSVTKPSRNLTRELYANIMQKDCFLVFRSLCKLSMKPLPEGYPDPKSHELRSKILSLQLLLGILQNGGHALTGSEIFVQAIKTFLCVALSQNGVSPISEVFELSLALFMELLTKYKRCLKSQIEIFFKEIGLNILEATTSSFEQKWLVIVAFSKICNDAQMVVDIYVNYDCDLNAANIFERLVAVLSKIAQGRQAFELGAASPDQLKGSRIKGLQSLVSILKCMVEWSRDLYSNPHVVKNLNNSNNGNNNMTHNNSEAELQSLVQDNLSIQNDDPLEYEKVKQHKHVLEDGIRLFNHKPAKGIKYFVDRNIIEDSLESRAAFLHENQRLDKTAIGDFLGELDYQDLMHIYVNLMNFSNMDFLKALRYFLEGFRLPGESQKIDRLMEKFASRYCECNPRQDIFKNADTVYVLAFSVIMLTTDLHNTSIKKKMTKEEFVKNNRGINDSEDLPLDYLNKIYDEIASTKIDLKNTSATVEKTRVTTDAKKRQVIWDQESANITKTAEALMESALHRNDDIFVTAKHIEHPKNMFKLAWTPCIAVFSTGLQDCDDAAITHLCLEGIQCAIRIACIFGFSLERSAFVQALATFTSLTDKNHAAEIKTKNIEAIKGLISVAYSDGNHLETSWLDVMKCISQLEAAQNNVSGLRNFNNSSNILDGGVDSEPSGINETNSQSILVAVDRIFTGSRNLNGDAIVHFVKALCQVSKDELAGAQPRMYSLNKLVEISYYNMERIRLEWSRIWAVLGNYFNVVGCNDSQHISIFATDSLKQLSLKFLEKGELQNFHFQKDFLRPFEFIMRNNKSGQIRDMVVRCISQMVDVRANNIKSGWKNIFATYALAASDSNKDIVKLSFQSTNKIVDDLLIDASSSQSLVDSFQDCVKCLSEFGCNPFYENEALKAINLIRKCAKYVSENKNRFLCQDMLSASVSGSDANNSSNNLDGVKMDRVWFRGWFPVLFELSCIINSSKLDIRTRSLTILFDIVKNHGDTFEPDWWRQLFGVLFRIFDLVKNDHNHKEWMDTTCNHTLYAMTDVFNEFFRKLAPLLLKDLLAQYEWCVLQDNDQLARSAASCLENLVLTNRSKMDSETEHCINRFLADLITNTLMPNTIAKHSKPLVPASTSVKSMRHRIQVHLEIISSIKRMIFGVSMKNSPSHSGCIAAKNCFQDMIALVDCLLTSHNVARDYLKNHQVPSQNDTTIVPLVVKQETESLKCALEILLELYVNQHNMKDYDDDLTEKKLLNVLQDVLAYFLAITSKSQQESWTGLLTLTFDNLTQLPEDKFRITMPKLYNHICDILSVQTIAQDLRSALCQILKKVGAVYHVTTSCTENFTFNCSIDDDAEAVPPIVNNNH